MPVRNANTSSNQPHGAKLSRERIIDTAMELVRADGLDSLSMRRIAQQLDVWPMSLYRYFHDKDELVEALADAAADRVVLPSIDMPWRQQAAELLRGLREAFTRHPGPAGLHVVSPRATPAGHRLSETGLAILRKAGFDEPEAARAWQALVSYTAGFPGLELAWPGAGATEDDFDYGLQRLLDGLCTRLVEPQPAS